MPPTGETQSSWLGVLRPGREGLTAVACSQHEELARRWPGRSNPSQPCRKPALCPPGPGLKQAGLWTHRCGQALPIGASRSPHKVRVARRSCDCARRESMVNTVENKRLRGFPRHEALTPNSRDGLRESSWDARTLLTSRGSARLRRFFFRRRVVSHSVSRDAISMAKRNFTSDFEWEEISPASVHSFRFQTVGHGAVAAHLQP